MAPAPSVSSKEVDRDLSRRSALCRSAQLQSALLILVCVLHASFAGAASPRRHFDLEAGDAATTLNEFGRQSDLQVLFDYQVLKGVQTHAVQGDLDASDALTRMLAGTGLVFDYVNSRTLTVSLRPQGLARLRRLWKHIETGAKHRASDEALEQVLVSGQPDSGSEPMLGAQSLQLSRLDIDRSGAATVQDFLRTLPQVFGGGPSEDTTLGREAGTNSARGDGINLRGLNAGATLVLLDGHRLAPSGTAGTFTDVSNLPLSIVDHIDLLPDGVAARYGADAIGGVVNFVTRNNVIGAQTQVRGATVTTGSMGQRQLSQLLGSAWESGNMLLGFEYFQQDALRTRDRRQATNDLTSLGGSNFDTPYGSPGTLTDGLNFWPIPVLPPGTPLTAAALAPGAPNLYDQERGADVTPEQWRWSLFGKASGKLTDDVSLFAESLFTRREVHDIQAANLPLLMTVPASNPFYVNPTGGTGPLTVLSGTGAYFGPPADENRIDTGNFSLGLNSAAGNGWTLTGQVNYTFETQHEVQHGLVNQIALAQALADPDPATALDPFGGANNPATLAAIGTSALFQSSSSLFTVGATASGPVLALPGGEIVSTLGAEFRDQSLDLYTTSPTPTPGYQARTDLGRHIASGFGDLRIPLLGTDNAVPLVQHLDLSLGARYEHYSDVGGATSPRFGLSWSPSAHFNLRGTLTRSFRPPNLPDLVPQNSFSTLVALPDPASPAGVTTVLARFGTNPDLRPERARTWTAGADYQPPEVPWLTLSLTYFDIRYEGRIEEARLTPDVLFNPLYSWLVNRNATAAQIEAVCAQSVYLGPPGTCDRSGAGVILDNRLLNIALLQSHGLDLIGKYSLGGPVGRWELGIDGTYLFEYSQASLPGAPLVELVSTQNNPIDLRVRGTAAWTHRGLGVAAIVNFANHYRDTLSVPERRVDSWTTLDLQFSYETGAQAREWLGHLQFTLSAQNLFDTEPPFLNNPVGVGYDQENADLYGRIVSLDIRKRW